MHCPDEFAACVQRMNEIRAEDPERYSRLFFHMGATATGEYLSVVPANTPEVTA